MSTTTEFVDLNLMHISMQFSDKRPLVVEDADALLTRARRRDVKSITFTEAGGGQSHVGEVFRSMAPDFGFVYNKPGSGDSGILVARSFAKGKIEPVNSGKVVDGQAGRYTDKSAVGVTYDTTIPGLGHMTNLAGHYLTKGRPDAHSPEYRQNLDENQRLADAYGDLARRYGQGADLVTYGGDQNIVDRLADTFLGNPFTSGWDELGKYENTGHGNIDVIATYDRDGRLTFTYIRALDDREFHLNTDHFLVEAGIRARLLKVA